MSLLRPDKLVADVACITPQMLEKMNVKALLLDLDGTLMPSHIELPEPAVTRWARDMQSAGIVLFLLSNNKSDARVKKIAELFGVDYASRSRKPRTAGYTAAAQRLELPLKQTAMVGDQIFTDTLGANRAGARSILVETLDNIRWYHRLRRFIENPFRKEKNA